MSATTPYVGGWAALRAAATAGGTSRRSATTTTITTRNIRRGPRVAVTRGAGAGSGSFASLAGRPTRPGGRGVEFPAGSGDDACVPSSVTTWLNELPPALRL